MCMLLALFVLAAVTTLADGQDTAPNFDCYPNQTIRFTNPDSGVYTHFKAFYDQGGANTYCNVTTDEGNNNAYIDCPVTTGTVTLYISARNLSIGDNILAKNSAAYMFFCDTPLSHNKTLTNALNVNISETAESDTPEYNITSAFYDNNLKEVTEATVGDRVYYVIRLPEEYDLKPLQCNATGSGATDNVLLITNGCSHDTDLISNFAKRGAFIKGVHRYLATIDVFKFYNSDTLTVSCMIEVCSSGGDCTFNCGGGGRRKRSVTIESVFKREVTNDEFKSTMVGKTLRVIDSQLGGSTQITGSSLIVATVLMLFSSTYL